MSALDEQQKEQSDDLELDPETVTDLDVDTQRRRRRWRCETRVYGNTLRDVHRITPSRALPS
jgi:hypothetical protein